MKSLAIMWQARSDLIAAPPLRVYGVVYEFGVVFPVFRMLPVFQLVMLRFLVFLFNLFLGSLVVLESFESDMWV